MSVQKLFLVNGQIKIGGRLSIDNSRKININNFYTASMHDWEEYFQNIFGDRNKLINTKLMWLKVIEHSTRVAEGIRKRKFFEAVSSITRVFAWTCTFIATNSDLFDGTSLEDIIWNKYPRACSYCAPLFSEEVCKDIERYGGYSCNCKPFVEQASQKVPRANWLKTYRQELKKPASLDDWSKMFDAIFYGRLSLMELDSVCFHLLEEVGEVLTAMRMHADFVYNFSESSYSFAKLMELFADYKPFEEILANEQATYGDILSTTKERVRQEVADVMSWLFSLVSKLLTLRASFSDYEQEAHTLIKEIPEELAFTRLTGYDVVRTPSGGDRTLNFSSILYIWYGNGCTHCRNLLRTGRIKCQCSNKIADLFVTSSAT